MSVTPPEPGTPPAAAPTPPADPKATDSPAAPVGEDKPLGENGEKALKAEREARAAAEKSAAALQKQLDDIAAANLSDLEKAQKAAKDAEEAAAKATTEALRLRVAAKHGISDEDADLFLTASDRETIEKQAAALAARTSTSPKPDLSQGAKGTPAGASPEQDFANFLGAQMSGRG
jgi:hypothetical protein